MKVEKIKNTQIADSGNNLEISFQGLSTIKLTFDFELAQELVSKCLQALAACRANRTIPDHLPRNEREIILVEGLEVNLYPDHSFDLLIETEDKQHVQVSLTDVQGKILRDVLLETDGKRPADSNPAMPIH